MLDLRMQERLPDTFNLDPKLFDHVLNVVTIDGRLHWNVHGADSSYRQTVLLTQASPREVSSAVHKLQEALTVLGHRLGCEQAAIDLGETTAQQCLPIVIVICEYWHKQLRCNIGHTSGSQDMNEWGMYEYTTRSLYGASHYVTI